jgi:hypothetical protein
MRSSRSLVSRFGLALFGLFLLVSLPLAIGRSARRIERAFRYRGESALDERSRVFGAAYARAIEQIRRTIPPDGVYAIVNGDAVDHGGPIWVRFDLAPRRAVLLGRASDLRDARAVRRKIPDAAHWVVVAYAEKPPQIIDRSGFLRHLEARR